MAKTRRTQRGDAATSLPAPTARDSKLDVPEREIPWAERAVDALVEAGTASTSIGAIVAKLIEDDDGENVALLEAIDSCRFRIEAATGSLAYEDTRGAHVPPQATAPVVERDGQVVESLTLDPRRNCLASAAGVPAAAFPADGKEKAFRLRTLNVCASGSHETLNASMTSDGLRCELQVDWGYLRPYCQGSHPAVTELARMLLKDMLYWTQGEVWSDHADLERPFTALAEDGRATDYKPGPGTPRLRASQEFHSKLSGLAMELFEMVHTECEFVVVDTADPRSQSRPARRCG